MNKESHYQTLYNQAKSLVEGETNAIANMGNLCSLLYHELGFWWVGFYLVEEKELVLGPFHGPVACTRIGYGKGVCGSAWRDNITYVVPDVHQFEGHIACSAESNSEIVIPLQKDGKVVGVFDVDSKEFDHFDEIDKKYLNNILALIDL